VGTFWARSSASTARKTRWRWPLELIDGQQRFTTISLLFCALYEQAEGTPRPGRRLQRRAGEPEEPHLREAGQHQWRFEPSEQAQNKADFQKVLSDLFPKLVAAPKGLSYFGNRRIAKAFAYFRDRTCSR
jgi:hypothetical protein